MTHDTKCYELAQHFLPNESKQEWNRMADVIQQAIEDELHCCKYCFHSFPDADIDEYLERICGDCERKRDDARRDEALGI